MLNNLKALTQTRFRRTNFKVFFFFLLFAVFIWIIAQFSKEYTEVVEIPVEYVNLPPDKLIPADTQKNLRLRLEESGFEIAYRSFFPPRLVIDLSEADQEEGSFRYDLEEHQDEVQAQLGINLERNSFLAPVVAIDFNQRAEKLLPVVPHINVEFAAGYAAAGELELKTDSITVSGPEAVLDTLEALHTMPLANTRVMEDISGRLGIDTTHLPNVTVYQPEVEYVLKVEKFTEGKLQVPVELINVPPELNVVIFPKEILLFYRVTLQDFNDIRGQDFRVVCDFNELKEGQDYLVPKVLEQPEEVENVRLNEKRISFIIKT